MAAHFIVGRAVEAARGLIAFDMKANLASAGERSVQRAVFPIGQRAPRTNAGMREDRIGIQSDFAKDRLPLRRDVKFGPRGKHGSRIRWAFGPTATRWVFRLAARRIG